MTAEATTPDANVVTDERAKMLANHAIYVQGGFSDPERERERAEKQIAEGGSIDWTRMEAEVEDAIRTRIAALPPAPVPLSAADEVDATEAPTGQYVDVTAVMANIDQGEALRDRIKKMQAELKVHEDLVKDALGDATTGTDASGKILVRYPVRNRTGLNKEKVREILSDEQFGACETVTTYRSLLYGPG